MPGEFKVKNGLLVSGSANVNASGSGVFTVDGTSGRLFQVDDSLSGSLFSVNTAAGLPVIEAFSDNTVRIGQFGQRALFVSQSAVGIGKETNLNAILDISGSTVITGSLTVITGSSIEFQVLNTGVRIGNIITDSHTITGSINVSGSITGSLFGTASFASTASFVITAQTASFITASNVRGPFGTSSILSASYASGSTSSSFASTASFIITAQTASFITASHVFGPFGTSSILSASYASGSTSASFALTASFALNAGGGSSNITIGDESITQGTATYLNFIGAGVTATVSSNTASITIPGGGGGGTNAKAGSGSAASFGGTPRTASITFGSAFSDNLYAVTVTGEDARTFTIQSKSSTGFTINSNSSVALTGPVYWIATAFN
jgi:hypothetical protein